MADEIIKFGEREYRVVKEIEGVGTVIHWSSKSLGYNDGVLGRHTNFEVGPVDIGVRKTESGRHDLSKLFCPDHPEAGDLAIEKAPTEDHDIFLVCRHKKCGFQVFIGI